MEKIKEEITFTPEQIIEYETLKKEQEESNQFMLEFAKAQKNLILDGRVNQKLIKKVANYTDTEIKTYLETPEKYEKQLREISRHLENTNLLYKRLIHYFANIGVNAFTVIPTQADKFEGKAEQIKKQYYQVIKYMDTMKLPHNLIKVKQTMIREDTFYGVIYENEAMGDFLIKQLNPDYCRISSWEQGCFNFEFDFSFFDGDKDDVIIQTYETIIPKFFKSGFAKYKKDKKNFQWQEVPSDKSMCVKFSDHDYSVPYFAGSIIDLIEIADYKNLEKTSVEQDNYKIISFKFDTMKNNNNKADNFEIKPSTALSFFNMSRQSLGNSDIGLIMSPMEMKPISFKDVSNSKNKVKDATEDFYNSNGVSQMLFNSNNSTSLKMSVKTDEAIVSQMNRQIESWVNRHIGRRFKNSFKVKMLDVTVFNQDDMVKQYLQLAQYGVPVKTSLATLTGQSPLDMVGLNFLETEILQVGETWTPLSSSHTQSGDTTDEGGRPQSNAEDLSETGTQTRENDANANRAEV